MPQGRSTTPLCYTWILAYDVLGKTKAADLVIPWLVAYPVALIVCFSHAHSFVWPQSSLTQHAQVSFGSLSTKLIGLFRAARLRREEAIFENTDPSSSSSKLLKHQKNWERTSRAVNSIYAGLAVALAECVPLGILQSMHWPLF